jgi:ankyrin repeat protein
MSLAPNVALFQSATSGNLEFLQQQQQQDDFCLVQAKYRHGSSLLHYAAGSGHVKICRFLLNIGDASRTSKEDSLLLDVQSNNNGRTALHWAARNGRTATCRLLAEALNRKRQHQHEKISSTDDDNEDDDTIQSLSVVVVDVMAKGQVTPLQLAVWKCHLTTAKCLVEEFHANPHFVNSWGCSVAHWLGKCPPHEDDDDGDDFDDIDENQVATTTTTTTTSNESIQKSCCEWLFQHHRIPHDIPNHHGQTPLHKAAYAGNFVVARYLVFELQVLDTVRDHQGNVAADCAEKIQQLKMARWLRRFASPLIRQALDRMGFTTTTTTQSSSIIRLIRVPPPVGELRRRYLELAKDWHPDRCKTSTDDGTMRNHDHWNDIHDAYSLLLDWHEHSTLCDTRIRMLCKNAVLAEYLPLCWHESWHEQQQQIMTTTQNIHHATSSASSSSSSSPNSKNAQQQLQDFERRLIRLLTPLGANGMSISQLPKEYEKNWHMPVPKPRQYKCRRLIQLIKKLCPNIQVLEEERTPTTMTTTRGGEDQPSRQPRLRVATPLTG